MRTFKTSTLALLVTVCVLGILGTVQARTPRFSGFPGPTVPVNVKAGERAWTASPAALDWNVLKLAQYKFVKTEGTEGLFEFGNETFHVPSAFIAPAAPAVGLKPRSPVLLSVYVTTMPGRVVAVAGNKVSVEFLWVNRRQVKDVGTDEVILMDGKARFGAPIAYREGATWRHAQMIRPGPKTSWVLGFAGKPLQVPAASIKMLTFKTFKAGDRVWVDWVGQFRPARVVSVQDNGLRYQVLVDGMGKKPEERVFSDVIAPF